MNEQKLNFSERILQYFQDLNSFYIHNLHYDIDGLLIIFGDSNESHGKIIFKRTRSFRLFQESDYYQYLKNIRWDTVVKVSGDGCGIFWSPSAPYAEEYNNLEPILNIGDIIDSYIIITPQHCVEVLSFDPPDVVLF